MGPEPRGRAGQGGQPANPTGEEPAGQPKPKVKSFAIPQSLIARGWERVLANGGAPGVDAVSVDGFAANEANNLYKLWNRMSSGSYFPGPVRAVEIPKDHGAGVRVLGVPNVADRIAQTAAAMLLEERLEPLFHPDSDGYRPGRDCHDALAKTRKRCWRLDWVLHLDIVKFFDSVPHDLLRDMVARHTDLAWVRLYIDRWLTAPMQMTDATLAPRDRGTPQGSPISPLLANLFLHYAFDTWMAGHSPNCPFERYADDIVVHCSTEKQARYLRDRIARRLLDFGLELHPDKTEIVYCKDGTRTGDYEHTSFDFLGYTFRARLARARRGNFFVGFNPAISAAATKAINAKIRDWHLIRRSGVGLVSLARDINPVVAGWINYYGAFTRSELSSLACHLDQLLVRWAMRKYKRFKRHPATAWAWLRAARAAKPSLFAHWWKLASFTLDRPVGAV